MDEEYTTISLMPSTKALLDKLKVHPNQSYDEIIREIIMKIKVQEVVKIPSYRVFGIYVDKTQSTPIAVNNDELEERISYLLSNKTIEKVVVKKEWV